MHCRLEIVLPNSENLESDIESVMANFYENTEDPSGNEFWDFYVIGGRFAGRKMEESLGEERILAFRQKLMDAKITVSRLQAGKQELYPSSQIPMVDEMWRRDFPETGDMACPLFAHSNDQYTSESKLPGDVVAFGDINYEVSAERVIIAAPNTYDGSIEAISMVRKSAWNGVQHEETTWDGSLDSAIENHNERVSRYREDAAEAYTVKADWLVVTVDYHS